MTAFQFYLQLRNQRKAGWMGDDSYVVFGKKKSPGEKGSVRWCVVMMQKPVILLPKSGAKSSHFSRTSHKTSQQYAGGIDCLSC
jgi:hypothetical protein